MRKILQSRKGFNINDVPALGILLVTIAIILGIGTTIVSQVLETQHCASGYYFAKDDICYACATGHTWNTDNDSCSISGVQNATARTAYRTLGFNATYRGVTAVEDLSEWQTTWAVIIAAAVVIGIISTYMFFKRGGD